MRIIPTTIAATFLASAAQAAPSLTAGGFALDYRYISVPGFTGFSLQSANGTPVITLGLATYDFSFAGGAARSLASSEPGRLRASARAARTVTSYDPTVSPYLLINAFANWTDSVVVGRPGGGSGTFIARLNVSDVSLSTTANLDATVDAPLDEGFSIDSPWTAQALITATQRPGTPSAQVLFRAVDAEFITRSVTNFDSGAPRDVRFRDGEIRRQEVPVFMPIASINRLFTFAIPFTSGVPFDLLLQLVCTAGSQLPTPSDRLDAVAGGAAVCEADRTLTWDGIDAAFDEAGNPIALDDLVVTTGSGFDLKRPFGAADPVPAPAAVLTLLFGLATLGVARRRRG